MCKSNFSKVRALQTDALDQKHYHAALRDGKTSLIWRTVSRAAQWLCQCSAAIMKCFKCSLWLLMPQYWSSQQQCSAVFVISKKKQKNSCPGSALQSGRVVVLVLTSRSRDVPTSRLGRQTLQSSLGYLHLVPKTNFRPNCAGHINKTSQFWARRECFTFTAASAGAFCIHSRWVSTSSVDRYTLFTCASVKLKHIAINKTCTLTSRSHLEILTSRSREVSVLVLSWAFTSRAHPCSQVRCNSYDGQLWGTVPSEYAA